MKTFLISLALLCSFSMNAAFAESYDPKADPEEQLATALAEAQADEKFVMMIFGSEWCPDCRVFSKLIKESPLDKTISDNFSVTHVDIGNWNLNMEFANQFDNPVDKGIPSIVILDKDKNLLYVAKGGEFASARTAKVSDLDTWFQSKVAEFKQ